MTFPLGSFLFWPTAARPLCFYVIHHAVLASRCGRYCSVLSAWLPAVSNGRLMRAVRLIQPTCGLENWNSELRGLKLRKAAELKKFDTTSNLFTSAESAALVTILLPAQVANPNKLGNCKHNICISTETTQCVLLKPSEKKVATCCYSSNYGMSHLF